MGQKQTMNLILEVSQVQKSNNTSITDVNVLTINPESVRYSNVIAFSEFTYV